MVGLIVIDGEEYELEGYSTIEEDEEIIVFETVDSLDEDHYVRVKIKNVDGMQRFDLLTVIDGVEKRTDVKLIEEENMVKVHLRLFEGEERDTYQFKKIVEDDKTIYMLHYKVGDVNGHIKIFEKVDENGDTLYRYKIHEGGKNKQVEKHRNRDRDKKQEGTNNQNNA